MTPAARIAAAIDILDRVLAGQPAEQVLIRWARGNRYAGSGDRAAIRDHVYDALRCKRSYAWLGGADTGRGLMLGYLRATGQPVEEYFNGSHYGPSVLQPGEKGQPLAEAPRAVRRDCPDWLLPHFDQSCDEADAVLEVLRHRAGVFLRVNLAKTTREEAMADLARDGVETILMQGVKTALQATQNHRKILSSSAYQLGLVELQDTASQRAMLRLPLRPGMRVLDLCAGGGGKSLAMAALETLEITAHDIDPARMADLPARAARAGATIRIAQPDDLHPPYDLVLVDAPCSGSGTWRRTPEAKWTLTPDRLEELTRLQDRLLDQAVGLLAPGGTLAYATCSVFEDENAARVAAALQRHPGLHLADDMSLRPAAEHDGFYLAVLK